MATTKKISLAAHVAAISSALAGMAHTVSIEARVEWDPKLQDYFVVAYGGMLLRFTVKAQAVPTATHPEAQ